MELPAILQYEKLSLNDGTLDVKSLLDTFSGFTYTRPTASRYAGLPFSRLAGPTDSADQKDDKYHGIFILGGNLSG
jgi:hypothetical protein